MDIGWELSRTGDTAGARAAFGQMLAIDQKLADAKPNATYFQQGLAISHHNIGRLLSAAGDPSGALSKYGQALAIRQKLADANPSVTEFQKDVAWSLHDIGWLLSKKGDLSGGQAAYGQVLAIRQKLADANPEVRVIRRDLVACRNDLSDLLRRNHHPAEARDDYDRALAIGEPLAREDDGNTWYQAGPAYSLRGRGLAHLDLGDLARATADTRRALQIWDGLPTRTGGYWFETACCHATLAALAGREGSGVPATDEIAHAAEAMALLAKVFAMGERDPHEYRTESALDPLHGRNDFRELMMDLVFPPEPFARGD